MKRLSILSACLCLSALLTACGGGPSDSEIEKAVMAKMAESQRAMASAMSILPGGGGATQEMERRVAAAKVEAGKKTEQQDGSYSVVVTVTVDGQPNTKSIRLIKGSDGWAVAD